MTDEELVQVVRQFVSLYGHLYGRKMMQGSIWALLGVSCGAVSQKRTAAALRFVAPRAYQARARDLIERTPVFCCCLSWMSLWVQTQLTFYKFLELSQNSKCKWLCSRVFTIQKTRSLVSTVRVVGVRFPSHALDDSLGKWMYLGLGQPMSCEGMWVVGDRWLTKHWIEQQKTVLATCAMWQLILQ